MAHKFYNAYTVREYEVNGEKRSEWIKLGVAFPLRERDGFNIELNAFPKDGKLVILPPRAEDTSAGDTAGSKAHSTTDAAA